MQETIFSSMLSEKAMINNKLVSVIFFGEYVSIDSSTGNPISVNEPRVCVKLSDVENADIKEMNVVKVRGKTYYISDIQRDGEGVVELMLKSRYAS